jgi:hypothetical protein
MKQRWSTLTMKKKTKEMIKEMDKEMCRGHTRYSTKCRGKEERQGSGERNICGKEDEIP